MNVFVGFLGHSIIGISVKKKKNLCVIPQHAIKYGLTSFPVCFHVQHKPLMETNTHMKVHYNKQTVIGYACKRSSVAIRFAHSYNNISQIAFMWEKQASGYLTIQ